MTCERGPPSHVYSPKKPSRTLDAVLIAAVPSGWHWSLLLGVAYLVRPTRDHAASFEDDSKKSAVAIGIDAIVIMLQKLQQEV